MSFFSRFRDNIRNRFQNAGARRRGKRRQRREKRTGQKAMEFKVNPAAWNRYKNQESASDEYRRNSEPDGNGGTIRSSYIPTRNAERARLNERYGGGRSSGSGGSSSGKYSEARIKKRDEDGNVYYVQPPISTGGSQLISKDYGLQGIGDNSEFAGMTEAEALRAAQQKNDFYQSQTSANTSYTFNPETLAKTRNIENDFQFKLKDITNDPFKSKGSVEIASKANMKLHEQKVSDLFESAEDFEAAYNSNPEFAESMDKFQSMGMDMNAIAAGIKPKQTVEQHTGGNLQDLATYQSIGNSASEQKAFNSLIPEGQLAADQIQKLANIPKNYMDVYMGTPGMIGVYEEKRLQAVEEKRILEQQAENAEDNARAEAKLQQRRADLDYDIESSQIETNRLNAKNYMTGMLAKLGALNTTGKAPEALATLEQKYQVQAQQLRSEYKFNKQSLDIKLDNYVNEIDTKLDNAVLGLEADLTNDKEKIYKEILKLQNKADSDIYKLQAQFAKSYRSQLEKYRKKASTNSKTYIKTMGSIASQYDVESVNSIMIRDMTFEEFLAHRQEEEQITFTQPARDELREEFNAIKNDNSSNDYSSLTQNSQMVMDGFQTLKELTPTIRNEVKKELYANGIALEDIPGYEDEEDEESSDREF